MPRAPQKVLVKPTQFSLVHNYQVPTALGRKPQGVSETLLCSKALTVDLGTRQVIDIPTKSLLLPRSKTVSRSGWRMTMHLGYGGAVPVGLPDLEVFGSPLNAILWAVGNSARVWRSLPSHCLIPLKIRTGKPTCSGGESRDHLNVQK